LVFLEAGQIGALPIATVFGGAIKVNVQHAAVLEIAGHLNGGEAARLASAGPIELGTAIAMILIDLGRHLIFVIVNVRETFEVFAVGSVC
jgi:hypothetical protein